ncbi:hypothetical protein OG800_49400 (plasmid) [Streptomyces sp. NBC_00445]|uniref:hypothetical protein n=1 Tax=Streptomyces sp. NBC_00445 TaxID=2975745 RepID=UPI002E24A77B
MSTESDQTPASGTGMPQASPAGSPWQLWVLLVWHPALGLPVDPVAVLGLDNRPDAPAERVIRWVPLVYETADPWRVRLGESTTRDDVERWRARSGVCQAEAVDVPDGATDLAHAAELVLDELLAEVIPVLPLRGEA